MAERKGKPRPSERFFAEEQRDLFENSYQEKTEAEKTSRWNALA
jgi:hypothetical protein